MSSVKYEIKKTEYRGFGMFATEKIQAGELIIKEEFIFKLCQQYSNVKQKLDDIEANLSSLSTEKRKTFFELSDCYQPNNPIALTIYQTNALPLGPGSISNAIFPTIARINHSCLPNSHHHWNHREEKETVYAIKDIEKGEEILISYIDTYLDREMRKSKLKDYFNFICACQLCSISDPVAVKKSNVRRRLLKNLEIEFLSSEGKASDRLDEKVNLFLKISKEENIYTRSCDIGGPCFTAFQFLHKHRIVEINDENTLNKNPYELLSYWAKMTIDFNLACKGFFEAEGLPLNIIYKYCDLNKEGKV